MTNMTDSRIICLATVAVAVAGALAPWPAQAAAPQPGEGSKQADIGIAAGLVVGAAAAGPIGAVLGAGVGGWLGDRYHRQATSSAALAADLDQSDAERQRLAASVTQLDDTLSSERAHGAELHRTLTRTDQVGFDVSFRTADDSISEAQLPPLLKLGALAVAMPQARVRVAGYADPRGSDAYNEALSLRRARTVAAALASAGVAPERIDIEAHGSTECGSDPADPDAYALERRVTVRLDLPPSDPVARRD